MTDKENQQGRIPLSKIQEQFWLLANFQPEDSSYNIGSFFHIKGELNINYIERGICQIIKKHPVLRTSFPVADGLPHQYISPVVDFQLEVEDLQDYDLSEEDLQEILSEEGAYPFHMEESPLVRATVYKLNSDDYILAIVFHHIVVDLHSKHIFSEELSHWYNLLSESEESAEENNLNIDDKPPAYEEFTTWENDFINSEKYNKSIEFWKKRLSKASLYTELPLDFPREASSPIIGDILDISFGNDLTKSLKNFSKENSVSLFVTMLSAYFILIKELTGKNSITLGVPLTNRLEENHKEIFGCLMNILPLTVNISDSDSYVDMIKKVRMSMLQAHRNQQVPFKEIVKNIQPERNPSYNPLYQVGFTFEPPMELKLNELEIEPLVIHNGGSQLDLFFNLWERDGKLEGRIEYPPSLFKEETIANFCQKYLSIVEDFIK